MASPWVVEISWKLIMHSFVSQEHGAWFLNLMYELILPRLQRTCHPLEAFFWWWGLIEELTRVLITSSSWRIWTFQCIRRDDLLQIGELMVDKCSLSIYLVESNVGLSLRHPYRSKGRVSAMCSNDCRFKCPPCWIGIGKPARCTACHQQDYSHLESHRRHNLSVPSACGESFLRQQLPKLSTITSGRDWVSSFGEGAHTFTINTFFF